MTIRLSIISLAGMARTLVAVGTSSDADMFLTTAAAAPRSTWISSPSAGAGAGAFGLARRGLRLLRFRCLRCGRRTALAARGGFRRWGGRRFGRRRRCGGRGRLGRLPIAGGGLLLRWLARGSSRLRIHANSGLPTRDPRGTCDTSPRPTTRSVRMVMVSSRQLLASIPSPQASGFETLATHIPAVSGYPRIRRLKANASAVGQTMRTAVIRASLA